MKINKNKNEKGVTLLALIVTVIVLLIISGIVLTNSFNKGLVDQAKNTRNEVIEFENDTVNAERSFYSIISSNQED